MVFLKVCPMLKLYKITGRGPLVDCVLRASETAHREVRCYAVEKNPNAIITYVHLQHPLQSTIQPSSNYHTTLFKAPYNPLQSTYNPL